jgi:hypothetical protein
MVTSGGRTVVTVLPKKETPVAGEGLPNCPFAITTVVNPEDINAFEPKPINEDGISMDVNASQFLNAFILIVSTDGIVMDTNATQFSNA